MTGRFRTSRMRWGPPRSIHAAPEVNVHQNKADVLVFP
jgi:hypothetical protein